MKHLYRIAALPLAAFFLAGCGDGDEAGDAPASRATPVTAAEAKQRDVDVVETTVGRLQSDTAPAVAAETSGRVEEVLVDAGDRVEAGQVLVRIDEEVQQLRVDQASAAVDRLEALRANAERNVERMMDLVQRESAAMNLLDDAEAELKSLTAQLAEARAVLSNARRALDKTSVTSPVDGIVQARNVARGDFVAAGSVLFELVTSGRLKAYLPFPERYVQILEPGMQVELSRPFENGAVTAPISDMRPMVGTRSRAVEAIVDLAGKADWPAQGSVDAEVVIETRPQSVTVPARSVVRRPAGDVVYVLQEDGTVEARTVEVGVRNDGWAEILDGVTAGERVVDSGAGFLTDGAEVAVREEE